MYFYLISALKRRLILELQDSFSRHPVYEKVVPFIQNKYAFDERPQFGIVIKGASANNLKLSAQNLLGTVESHVMLSYLDTPSYLLEWVKEDFNTVKENGGGMPIPAGVYYIECLDAPTNPNEVGHFIIDPLLTVTDEPLLQVVSGVETRAKLQNPPVPGTLRIWINRKLPFYEGVDYSIDYTSGEVSIISNMLPGQILTADYRYPIDSIGPIEWKWNTADWTTLPGAILAFGKRGKKGDKVVVVIYEDRVDTATAYGGKFEASFDFDVIAQDPMQMEEMADYTLMSLWHEKRPNLSFEGLEITDVSIGGEAEEAYDEVGDIYYYTASMSVQIQSDWEVHLPLPYTLSGATAATKSNGTSTIQPIPQTELFFSTVPIIVGRNANYERIT
jgi:hypothetical protein